MKAKISALMDGELPEPDSAEPLRALRDDEGEALETWRRYHLIGDALRDTSALSSGFSARLLARLAAEPTVLSPASVPPRPEQRRRWVALSAAASLAAISMVGWLAFAPQQNPIPGAEQIAQAPAPALVVPAENPYVPLPRETDDYLLAHQNYSPRSTLQGVAPYVRTVSESVRTR